jgi:hypothetical protein
LRTSSSRRRRQKALQKARYRATSNLNGKEGVAGSSPAEGSSETRRKWRVSSLVRRSAAGSHGPLWKRIGSIRPRADLLPCAATAPRTSDRPQGAAGRGPPRRARKRSRRARRCRREPRRRSPTTLASSRAAQGSHAASILAAPPDARSGQFKRDGGRLALELAQSGHVVSPLVVGLGGRCLRDREVHPTELRRSCWDAVD